MVKFNEQSKNLNIPRLIMKEFEQVYPEQLEEEFQKACEDRNIEHIKKLLLFPGFDKYIKNSTNIVFNTLHTDSRLDVVKFLFTDTDCVDNFTLYREALDFACHFGNKELIDYLLLNEQFKEHGIFVKQNISANILANICRYGYVHLADYLLTNPAFKDIVDIHAENNKALISACGGGNLDIVKYLLSAPELKKHADIHAQDDRALYMACICNNLPLMKYLLTSPDLKEHANLHARNNAVFKNACEYGRENIINYLIFDINMPVDEELTTWLNTYHEVNSLIQSRNLNDKLNNELQYANPKNKIKI